MKTILIASFSVCLCGASCLASDAFYMTASGGKIFGSHAPALEAKPYLVHGESRNAFAPSIAAGYRYSERISFEAAITGDGTYSYDYEYGLSPFVRPGDVVAQVTQRLLIKESAMDLALRMPIHFKIGRGFSVDIIPGLNGQMRRVEYYSRIMLARADLNPVTVGETNTTVMPGINDWLMFRNRLGRLGVEGGVRCTEQISQRLSLFAAYRYTQAMRNHLSTVSLGAVLKF